MIDKNKLAQYIEEKWIISQVHPTLPLTIYNYSQSTQFERKWDEITLACRGLVLDENGTIVARPFKKFFNWEEIKDHPEFPASKFAMPYEVFDKEDGSLGIGFFYKGTFVVATRGSFTSDQAIRATTLLKKYDLSAAANFSTMTFLFEIIYPENRIVVDYKGEEKLVMLGMVETSTGEEVSYDIAKRVAEKMGMPFVKKWEEDLTFEKIKALNTENKEGVVVKFSWGRMKIKFDDYVALHRILTNCSSYDIWENLMTFGELPKELFDKVPDEFFGWVRETRDRIMEDFQFIEAAARAEFKVVLGKLFEDENFDIDYTSQFDASFAEKVKGHRMAGLLFALKKMYAKQGRSTVKEMVIQKKKMASNALFTLKEILSLKLQDTDELTISQDEKEHFVIRVYRERPETDEELLKKQTEGFHQAIWKMVKPEYSKPFAEKE
jgi:RNA ligase